MMEWKEVTQTNAVWWICLLLANLVSISRQEAPNQTVSLGDEGGAGSGPYSGESERAANGATPGESLSGNKTFSFIRSGPTPVKEAPNASIEQLGQSLTRLEGSLGSLIQSFLAMQRSVSNLEQLQELLVLLLEDILKQTGNMIKSPKATRKGTHYKDTDTKSSNESNEDDVISGGGGEADRNVNNNNNAPRGNEAGKVGDDDFSLASRPLGDSQNEPQSNSNKGSKADVRQSWSPDKTSSSAEDRSTSEDMDVVNAKPFLDQGRLAPQDKGPNRSPQWAEPMTIDRGNILATFREAVSRLIARPPTFDGQEFQQLRLLREDHREANALPAESPAESPPMIFEPLEVKTSERNFLEKHVREETLPVQVRLSHLLPVVSHGGPLDGPEKSTSPFLEDLSDIVGKEYSGERPTGMINNLKLPDAMWGMTAGNDSSEEVPSTSPSAVPENTTSFVRRRRRQAWDRIQFSFNTASHDTVPEVTTSSLPLKTNLTDQERGLVSSPQNVSVGSNNLSLTNVTDSLSYGEDPVWKDYDHLIDSLLKDLSDRLKEYQSHQMTGDVTIDRAVHELNKLIWMPSFAYGGETSAANDTLVADIAQRSTNVSFVSQPMESYTKHLQFAPSNESHLHTEKQGNSTYLIQAKKKIKNYIAKQLGLEMQNETILKQQEIDYNQIINSTSEWMWIASVPSAMRMPETDLKWLTETLALLSQRQDLAKDMEEIARRAWEMSQKRLESQDPSRLDTKTAEDDKHDDLEDEDEEDGDISERRASLNSINGDNSVASDNRKEISGVSNRLDEAIQEVINALKDSMQNGNTVTDQAHPKNPTSRDNVGITDVDSGLNGFHGQHGDTLEQDEEDSEDSSHEDRGHKEVNNGLPLGQIHMHRTGHRIATPEKHHMTFPTYLRNHREKRSRHKRLSGMLWRQLLQPQPPDSTQLTNQGGSPPLEQHPPTHQSRNNSVPYSNRILSSYYHMYPYRRHLTNEPWGQRFLRPYSNPLGYANYMSHLGINNPNWIHQALEPDEPPANDVLGSTDVEDALTALFQRYWQRLFDVYSRSNPQTTTTEEPDHDGESIAQSPSNPVGENKINSTSTSSPATVMTTNTALPSNWQETANQTIKTT